MRSTCGKSIPLGVVASVNDHGRTRQTCTVIVLAAVVASVTDQGGKQKSGGSSGGDQY